MPRRANRAGPRRLGAALLLSLLGGASGCDDRAPSLIKSVRGLEGPPTPSVDAEGPRLGAIADDVPVYGAADEAADVIGLLHAGASVARGEQPYGVDGCEQGWYPIYPKGFVCIGAGATLELKHPTMVAMKLRPDLQQPLPYSYARTRKKTALFERDPERADGVREKETLPRSAGLAIVGSWNAFDSEGRRRRLAMTTNGYFLDADDLRDAEASEFEGVELDGEQVGLPMGFIVRRGVRTWELPDSGEPEAGDELDYHSVLHLTGRFRTVGEDRFWAVKGGRWVRHKDTTVVRRRSVFPDFVSDAQRWVDISIITGTAVLYEGKRPVFATLVSVGRDRLSEAEGAQVTLRGTFQVRSKAITAVQVDPSSFADGVPLFDAPWWVELSSGQGMHGSYWHDRFGIEHGLGSVQWSPADAQRMWAWVLPELPAGWHGVVEDGDQPTLVLIRN